jgi:hypothetical protein
MPRAQNRALVYAYTFKMLDIARKYVSSTISFLLEVHCLFS